MFRETKQSGRKLVIRGSLVYILTMLTVSEPAFIVSVMSGESPGVLILVADDSPANAVPVTS